MFSVILYYHDYATYVFIIFLYLQRACLGNQFIDKSHEKDNKITMSYQFDWTNWWHNCPHFKSNFSLIRK